MTKGAKVSFLICVIMAVLASIFGITYVFTSKMEEFDGERIFLGHTLDGKGAGEMTEWQSFVTGMLTIASGIACGLALTLMTKGLSRPEKKEIGKKYVLVQIGFLLVLIGGIVMMILTPKYDVDYEAKSPIWIILCAFLIPIGTILTIVGIYRGYASEGRTSITKE